MSMMMMMMNTTCLMGIARIVCGTRSMQLSGVFPSVCLSVPSSRRKALLQVCCCGPGGQMISINCSTACFKQQ